MLESGLRSGPVSGESEGFPEIGVGAGAQAGRAPFPRLAGVQPVDEGEGEMDPFDPGRRVRWLEGQVAAGLGDLARAEPAFVEVRTRMAEEGLTYHSALAGLDLAAVWFRQGRIGAVPPLVEELIDAFRARGIAREALMALALLRDAYEAQALSLHLIQRVSQLLAQMERFGIHGADEPVER